MKKKKKLLLVLLLLAAALGIFAYWQRENLSILVQAGQYTPEELETRLEENRQTLQRTLEQYPELSVREPTEEETQALQSGAITPEELAQTLAEPEKPENPEADAPSAELSALIARVLILQKLYVGRLEALEEEAKAEYRTMPEEQRKKTELVEWASGYVKRATEMERECDAQIDGIVGEMLAVIRDNGGDAELPDKVLYSYAEEKRLKKAWYLSRLEERGLLK